jgi:2-amino-4-hydroxy-6-hydroxymethyldihydropteridine diphosphokinase
LTMFRSPSSASGILMTESAMPFPSAPPANFVEAVISFGANLGERAETIRAAVAELTSTPGIDSVRLSSLIESVAVTPEGPSPEAPAYLNAVALVQTSLTPRELLIVALRIEQRFGRVRTQRWAARTLDIDIIAFGDERVDEPDLVVPHSQAEHRLFVVKPWLELDPEATLVGVGRVADLVAALERSESRTAEVTP